MKYLIYTLILFSTYAFTAEMDKGITIVFAPAFQEVPLNIGEGLEINDSLEIETLKCYISNFKLYDGSKVVFKEENSYHLLDASEPSSLQIELKTPSGLSYSHIEFSIGVDSFTNVSGALGGDLDPTNGMYWTWQSGYINFKLEGIATHCPARHNRFQFHVGGYQFPYATMQQVRLKVNASNEITIALAIDKLLAQIDLKEKYQIMSPNEEAVAIAKKLSELFFIKE